MEWNRIIVPGAASLAFTLFAGAQAPPPSAPAAAPPPPASAAPSIATASHTSRVRTIVYGPQGEALALVLRDGVAVSLPPDLGTRLSPYVQRGARVQVSGAQQVIAGQTTLQAASITVNGQTLAAGAPPAVAGNAPPPPPAAGIAPPPPPPPPGAMALRPGRRAGSPPPPPPVGPDGVAPPPPGPGGAAPPPPPDASGAPPQL